MSRLVALSALALFVVVVVAGAVCVYAGDVNRLQSVINSRLSALNALGAGAIIAETNTFSSDASAVAGFLTDLKSYPMALDGSLRAEGFGEVLLAAAVLRMIQTTGSPQLDETIPSQFLPSGVPFVHPTFNKPLTLRMLLTHTSALKDTSRMTSAEFQTAIDSSTKDILTFGDTAFITGSTTTTQAVASDVWEAVEPGLSTSHKWQASNVALLTVVLQKRITAMPTLVASSQRSVWAYIQEQIIAPLGMTSTFVFMPDGAAPMVRQGIVGVKAAHRTTQSSTQKVEASYLSGRYMVQTSLLDMTRLFRALFLPGGLLKTDIGDKMIASPVTLPAKAPDTSRLAVKQQGLGVVLLDRTTLCAAWTQHTASAVAATCPFEAGSGIPAFVSIIDSSSTSNSALLAGCAAFTASNAVVTPAPGVTTTTLAAGQTPAPVARSPDRCFASAVIVSSAATLAKAGATNALHAMAAEAMLQSTDTALDIGGFAADIVTPDTQSRGPAWGIGLFGILVALFMGILVWSYVAEIIVTQAPLSGDLTRAAYPYLDKLAE